jgi:hypothetical protein
MAVGFGEAGGVPPSYALITDTFAPASAERARHLQSRAADRRGARHRVRRVDRRGVRLARRVHRDRRVGIVTAVVGGW